MSQVMDDAQYQLRLCRERAQRAEAEAVEWKTAWSIVTEAAMEQQSLVIAQEAALKIYRQDIDLWDWVDITEAREHTTKAELFTDWYEKTGLVGVRNQRDALQGSFAKAVASDE